MNAPIRHDAARALSISKVAQRFGLRPSAVRYYEQIGILPAPMRIGGKRRYDSDILRRLAVVQRARQIGFSLDEIAVLFSTFDKGAAASRGWRALAEKKIAELEQVSEGIRAMQELLQLMKRCNCNALEECGDNLLKGCGIPQVNRAAPLLLQVSAARIPRLFSPSRGRKKDV